MEDHSVNECLCQALHRTQHVCFTGPVRQEAVLVGLLARRR